MTFRYRYTQSLPIFTVCVESMNQMQEASTRRTNSRTGISCARDSMMQSTVSSRLRKSFGYGSIKVNCPRPLRLSASSAINVEKPDPTSST